MSPAPARPLTPALVLGALCVPLVCGWVVRSEIVYRSADLSASSPSIAALFLLLVMLAGRGLLGRRGTRITPSALLLVYIMVSTTAGLATLGFAQSLIIQLPAPFWRQDPASRWDQFTALIPSWAAPRDASALRAFYLGGDPWGPATLHAWAAPLAFWTLFTWVLTGFGLALAAALEDRFLRQERLAFPLAVAALELTGATGSPSPRSRAFWVGLGIAVAIHTLGALGRQFATVRAPRVLPVDWMPHLQGTPFAAVGTFWTALYPCAIGLGYLLPLDTSLSCWVWHLAVKAQYVLTGQAGLRGAGWPFQGEQAQGAMLLLAAVALWPRRGSSLSISTPGRLTLAAAAVLVALFMALGMQLSTALGLLAVYALNMVAITRLRAQVGPMWNPGTDLSWLVMSPVGSQGLPPRDLTALAQLRWFTYGDCRGAPMPTQLESLRIARSAGIPTPLALGAMALALLLAVPSSLGAVTETYVRFGADTAAVHPWRTGRGDLPWQTLASWLGDPQGPRTPSLLAIGAGGLGFWLQSWALHYVSGWPLSPAGFAMAITGSLEWLWFPIFLAWLIKTGVLRWGGMRVYRRSVPFFMGLVAGDYAMSGLLAVLSVALHRELYRPFPI